MSCRDTSCQGMLFRDIVQRSCMEIYYSNLAQSFSLQRACTGIFYRDCLGSCQAISYGPLVLRSCIEITDSVLPRRSLQRNLNTGSLHSDQRSCTHFSIEIFTEGTCRIYPGFSFFSCSLQDCLGSLAGTIPYTPVVLNMFAATLMFARRKVVEGLPISIRLCR